MIKEQIELLSPAKNLLFGKIAINHGADAVYIGAPQFSARKMAGNSLQEIEELIQYAHLYNAKVYVALNTLLYDSEIEEAYQLSKLIYNAGADGLIIQDMGLLEFELPPIPLHASTQTHNYSLDKITFLERVGFERVVLARELSINQIKAIKDNTKIKLEVFIHGALCVCFSGQCYMSYSINGRSGNRGECSQPCRSAYNLIDNAGDTLMQNTHLLSLKDFSASNSLNNLIDIGVSSFKIEGRLKNESYLKNVTSFYRKKLDSILEENPHITRSSSGKTTFFFEPDIEKTFNRGYTTYFLNSIKEKVGSPFTQKSIGKFIGTVIDIKKNYFELDSNFSISNGDGLCFLNKKNTLIGFSVNHFEGKKIFVTPKICEGIQIGTKIFRNFDILFEKQLKLKTAERKIAIKFYLYNDLNKLTLKVVDEDGYECQESITLEKNETENTTNFHDNIIYQLSKTGNTPFIVQESHIMSSFIPYIPSSIINELRRRVIKSLELIRISEFRRIKYIIPKNTFHLPQKAIKYNENIINEKARAFYQRHGITDFEWGVEKQNDIMDLVVMECKYCIKYQLDMCPTYQDSNFSNNKLFLENNKNKYELIFDCKRCIMKLKKV